MSKNKSVDLKFASVSDLELIRKMSFYLCTLRPLLPSCRLKDCCSGALALIFELSHFLDSHNITDYDNYSK